MKKYLYIILLFSYLNGFSQKKLEFSGELSSFFSFAPDNQLNSLAAIRYLPQLDYTSKFKNSTEFSFEAAANINGNSLFHPMDSFSSTGELKPYRLWARYSGKQFELRLGLQKINFGSAQLLRPLQWFDDVDPSDPLQFTNGVYGFLGRYYFLNNANIWFWALYGNENPRGLEAFGSNKKKPELGGRIQFSLMSGELAFSYHHRTANAENLEIMQSMDSIPENKIGIDGKWDLGVGLWFEAAFVKKEIAIPNFKYQEMLNVGSDYTFDIGNGLNLSVEHLALAYDEKAFQFNQLYHITSFLVNYSIGFFDQISLYGFYLWDNKKIMPLINYQHDFKHFSTYLMAYYTPKLKQNILGNNYSQQLTGSGLRLIIVFNH